MSKSFISTYCPTRNKKQETLNPLFSSTNFNSLTYTFKIQQEQQNITIMANNSSQPFVVEDCMGMLSLYNDGSIFRSNKPFLDVPVHEDVHVLWKDVIFDDAHKLELRLYKPASLSAKVPILYYFHGGGFCIGSRTWQIFQNYCLRLASELHVVVISPDYRLAPENRLPAAIDDGYMALKWLQEQALSEEKDAWLSDDVADFDRVFVVGDSAGGNMAHNLGVRLGAGSVELAPVRIRGYVHLAAFFGGTVRTKSEEGSKDSLLNLDLIDRFWRLSIPIGETTDHPVVNPFGPNSPGLQAIDLDPILAIMGGDDLLRDRVREYVEKLKSWGKKIEYVEFEGKQHGFFAFDLNTEASKEVVKLIKNFILGNSG